MKYTVIGVLPLRGTPSRGPAPNHTPALTPAERVAVLIGSGPHYLLPLASERHTDGCSCAPMRVETMPPIPSSACCQFERADRDGDHPAEHDVPDSAARLLASRRCGTKHAGRRPRNPLRSYEVVRAGRGWPDARVADTETRSAAGRDADSDMPTRGAGEGLPPARRLTPFTPVAEIFTSSRNPSTGVPSGVPPTPRFSNRH